MINARRSLAALVALASLLTGCGLSNDTAHAKYPCLEVNTEASRKKFITTPEARARARVVELNGIPADINIAVSDSPIVSYSFEAPRELKPLSQEISEKNGEATLTLSLHCSGEPPVVDRFPTLTMTVGRGSSLSVNDAGGKVTIGDTDGPLAGTFSGTFNTEVGRVQSLDVDVSGTGDLTVGEVTDTAKATASGTGNVNITYVAGRTELYVSGTGDATVESADSPSIFIDVSGTGSAFFDGSTKKADLNNSGTGDISVGAADTVQQNNTGTGEITVG